MVSNQRADYAGADRTCRPRRGWELESSESVVCYAVWLHSEVEEKEPSNWRGRELDCQGGGRV